MTNPPAALMSEELRKRFGANLRAARLRADMTQRQLADAAGQSRAYVNQIENGAQNITLETMAGLARAVGLDVRRLLAPIPTERK